MRHRINLALSTIVFAFLALGCARQPMAQRLIFNIPGPDVPLHATEWELYEHHFQSETTPSEASFKLQSLGYRLLTPDEEHLARAFAFEQCHLIALSLGLIYLDHPIIVLVKREHTNTPYIFGFDQGLAPRPMRQFYEHAKLGEEYGWLVMRQKPLLD
ncbi:MAG: hypothetical protein A2534_01490 [Candidatus Magasanikbacteria bacterium RIFOXYD2_FULL_39_9]|uniref:Lipoprotein n=1 Tax=Candidatus Magasanikbacteria bacterium RIFOXYD1_FULL_40_23 TaxID=1798705 RepID=A0A1F6P8R6_9BACT|nr:MAG: hypothetical protein A2534_01490 [Candidatus Magasanikbacteria bacterium RIFOXYD2_FULL_39_9]OGH92559.1 MAG: hypothetical protein A2563_02680 [Candidatus Magasanikbacteria bacterium RIFOXYD1_FULL_40_23]